MRTIRPVFLAALFTLAAVPAFAQVDMMLTKSGSPAVVQAGSNITYTIVVTNNGPNLASQVSISDNIPANTTFVSVTDPPGTAQNCFYPPGSPTVACTANFMDTGDTWTITLVVRVDPATPAGTIITNTASVSAFQPDPNPANNSDGETTTVSAVPPTDADVYVSKTNAPIHRTLVGRGEVASYTITVGNDGPLTAANVNLTDVLPAGTTFESLVHNSGPAFSCTTPAAGATGTVTCTNAGLADQAESTYTLSVRLDANAAGSIANTATVSTTTPEPDTSDNSATATITATNPGADIEITKSASPPLPSAGDIITYTVTVTNIGSQDAFGVLMDDAVPANTTFVSANTPGTGAGCTPPQFSSNGHIQCATNTGAMPAGTSRVYTINVRVSSDAVGATITNTATVSTTSTDPDPANNSATAVTNVSPVPPATADISVAKVLPSSQLYPVVGPGETMTYAIAVRNDGSAVAQNVTLADTLPANTTFESFAQSTGPIFNCTTPAVGAGGTITCTIASLAVGAQSDFTLVLRAASNATGTISNTATVTSDTPDNDTSDNQSTRVVTVSQSTGADVRISKTSTPANATPGQNLVYNITVTNLGSRAASDVRVSDPIPAQTTFVTYTEPPATGINCFPPVNDTNAFTCTAFALGPGDSLTFTFTVRVNDDATGTAITNTATVTAAAFTPDPDTSNNTVTIQSPLPPTTADLAVTKTTPDPFVGRGDTTTFTITLTNNGPLAAQNVTLTDAIPAGTTFESFVQNAGPAFACNTAGTVSCTNASFANGAAATFTLTVRVAANAAGTITNTASASSQTPDSANANNSASASFEVTQPGADLDVAKTADAGTVVPGSNLTYTITVTNIGSEPAASIAVSDPIPANTTFVSVADDGGAGTTCNPPVAGVVQCTIDALTPGQTRTITLVVNVSPNATGTIGNTATVTSPSVDPDATNNAGTAATAVGAAPGANIPTLDPRVLLLLAIALAAAGLMAVRS